MSVIWGVDEMSCVWDGQYKRVDEKMGTRVYYIIPVTFFGHEYELESMHRLEGYDSTERHTIRIVGTGRHAVHSTQPNA